MYRRIYPLLGLSILFVVVSHGITNGLYALVAWTHRYSSLLPAGYNPLRTPEWYILITAKIILAFCLPAFYFISGYFAAYARNKETGVISYLTIKARVIGLLIPYSIWVVFGLLVNIGLGDIASVKDGALYLLGFNSYPFIINLIIFYLLSALFMKMAIKTDWRALLVSLLILQVLALVLRFTVFNSIKDPIINYILVDQFWPSVLNYIPYFPLGILFGLFSQDFSQHIQKFRCLIVASLLAFITANILLGATTTIYVDGSTSLIQFLTLVSYHGLSVCTILTYILFDKFKLPLTRQLTTLGSYALGIYLIHSYVITYFGKLVYHLVPKFLNMQIVFSLISTLVGLFITLGALKLFKKMPFRSLYPYLFG